MKKIKATYLLLTPIVLGLLIYICISAFNNNSIVLNESIESYNFAIGTQTVGSKYKFTDKSMLVETAVEIKNMGSNLLKFSMNPRYFTENYGLPENKKINSLTKLATLEPSVKEVLDMNFKYYHIWTYEFSQYSRTYRQKR